jgi:hypothetical protein
VINVCQHHEEHSWQCSKKCFLKDCCLLQCVQVEYQRAGISSMNAGPARVPRNALSCSFTRYVGPSKQVEGRATACSSAEVRLDPLKFSCR